MNVPFADVGRAQVAIRLGSKTLRCAGVVRRLRPKRCGWDNFQIVGNAEPQAHENDCNNRKVAHKFPQGAVGLSAESATQRSFNDVCGVILAAG
jgi:hypothetical protein